LGDKVAARLATGSTKEPGPTRAGKERPGSAQKQRSAGGQPVRGGAAAASSSAGAATPSQPPAVQAAVNDMPAPAAQQPPPPNRLDRQYSTASWNTVSTLQQLELEVEAMEKQTTDHEDTLDNPPPDGLPLGMRNQMAQLHGDFNKLLATRLDAILTGELTSGKDDARAKRKALIKKVEGHIEKVESLVKRYDAAREAGKSM